MVLMNSQKCENSFIAPADEMAPALLSGWPGLFLWESGGHMGSVLKCLAVGSMKDMLLADSPCIKAWVYKKGLFTD